MKIYLTQDEIAQAVREFVGKGVTLANGNQMAVDFSMGRGENGLSATIDVPYMGVNTLPVSPVQTAAAPAAPVAKSTVATPQAPATSPAATAAAEATSDTADTTRDAPPFQTDAAGNEVTATEGPASAPASGKSLFSSPPAQ